MKQVIFLLLFVLCFNSLSLVGQNYVKIGQLYWGIQNLNNSTFRNGQEIARAKNPTEWEQFFKNGEPAYCSLNYNEKNDSVYGKIYNWFAVVDPRGLAPEGFKIPTSNEWSYLRAYLNYDTVCRCALYKNSADKLRSANQWKSKTVGQNLFQMNVEPLGYVRNDGNFEGRYMQTTFWTTSPKNQANVIGDSYDTYYVIFNHDKSDFYLDNNFEINGHFVRCIQGEQEYFFSKANVSIEEESNDPPLEEKEEEEE